VAETRKFHLGEVLSVTTGRLVAPGHIGAVHALLDFMTRDTLFTHQLPRAMRECRPELLRQHPKLAGVPVPEGFDGEADVLAWLAGQVATYGEFLVVSPLAAEDHTRVNPLTELAMNYPHLKVIPVVLDDKISGEGQGSGDGAG
jgi:hypothetical protein